MVTFVSKKIIPPTHRRRRHLHHYHGFTNETGQTSFLADAVAYYNSYYDYTDIAVNSTTTQFSTIWSHKVYPICM